MNAASLSQIHGFNYQPSYGTSGLEIWQKFDPTTIHLELGRGKKYFPKMNAIRFWLSWEAFRRNPARFADDFDHALVIANEYGLLVMPVLFNRWHDSVLDYGGIYVDHFLPNASWVQSPNMFEPYLEAIVHAHASDPRIFAWDLCNEPFSYNVPPEKLPQISEAEWAWLESIYKTCKRLKATAPLTVGTHQGFDGVIVSKCEPISDIISVHPYFFQNGNKDAFRKQLDGYVEFANKMGKPLIASETCWGSLDDKQRVEIIRFTLGELKKRGIGYLAYILHHSLIADSHRPEFGPVGFPGNLAFIEADGSLRAGHEVFNEF